MSEVSPEAQAAVQASLAAQAATVGGTDSAGIYGDVAGASQQSPPQSEAQVAADLQAAGAQPAQGNVADLQAQIDALNARLQADADAKAQAAADAAPKAPVLEEIIGALSGAGAGVVHAFTVIAERLDKAGL